MKNNIYHKYFFWKQTVLKPAVKLFLLFWFFNLIACSFISSGLQAGNSNITFPFQITENSYSPNPAGILSEQNETNKLNRTLKINLVDNYDLAVSFKYEIEHLNHSEIIVSENNILWFYFTTKSSIPRSPPFPLA